MFKLIFKHFDSIAYQRLVQLHRRKAKYGLGPLVEQATGVWHTLRELHQLASEADSLVNALREDLKKALSSMPKDLLTAKNTVIADRANSPKGPSDILTAAVYEPPEQEPKAKPTPALSKSFSVAEEEVARRGHARAATFSEAGYTATSSSAGLVERAPALVQGTTVGARRKGVSVPRVFTGSFSQLESDIRRLQIDKVKTPEGATFTSSISDRVQVRDFGATPCVSPCPTPSPQTPLQRREAFVSRETECQDRLIRGEVVTTRRPSTKGRAQTMDETTGGLDAWLGETSPSPHSTNAPGSAAQRSNARHQENTL